MQPHDTQAYAFSQPERQPERLVRLAIGAGQAGLINELAED